MLVTVMGWLSLVVGLLRMVFPTNRRTNDECARTRDVAPDDQSRMVDDTPRSA